jgi:glutamate--cysteine ligase
LTCALPALWKGILYEADACEAAWSLVEKMSTQEREDAQIAVSREGLAATIGGRSALELAREFVGIASEALGTIGKRKGIEPDESHFLNPIWAQLETGKSPGEILAERWDGEWKQSPAAMIDFCTY